MAGASWVSRDATTLLLPAPVAPPTRMWRPSGRRRLRGRGRGRTRTHTPSREMPFYLVLVDEIASLTAYVSDRALKERARQAPMPVS